MVRLQREVRVSEVEHLEGAINTDTMRCNGVFFQFLKLMNLDCETVMSPCFVYSHLAFWNRNFLLIAQFLDNCLLLPLNRL